MDVRREGLIMRDTKGGKGFLTVWLLAGIIMNLVWSMRLELEAAKVRSLVDEHHASLQRNSDELARLKRFYRSVGENDIDVQDQGIYITSGKYDLGFAADNLGIRLSSCSRAGSKNCLPVELSAGSGKERLKVTLDPTKERVEIRKGLSILRIGTGDLGEGVEMGEVKTGTVSVTKGKGVGIVVDKSLRIQFDVEDTGMGFLMDPVSNHVYLLVGGNYGFGAGTAANGVRWIAMNLGDKKSIRIIDKQGLAIESDDKPMFIYTGQYLKITSDADMLIRAGGDINLESKNGNVKINGKRILLND